MKICKNCEGQIPNRVWIDGKLKITNNRTYCLACSPFGSKNTRRLHLEMGVSGERLCNCTVCKKDYIYSRTKSNSTIVCPACTQNKRRKDIKEFAVNLKGGKCHFCSYSRCLSSLTFHHLDPSKKEFGISSITVSKERIEKELSKCILVCRNCHGEIEDGLISVGVLV